MSKLNIYIYEDSGKIHAIMNTHEKPAGLKEEVGTTILYAFSVQSSDFELVEESALFDALIAMEEAMYHGGMECRLTDLCEKIIEKILRQIPTHTSE